MSKLNLFGWYCWNMNDWSRTVFPVRPVSRIWFVRFLPGAEIRSVCTEAGMFAIRARRKIATEKDFLEAVNKVIKSYAKFSATPRYMTYNWECVCVCGFLLSKEAENWVKNIVFLLSLIHLKIKFIPELSLTALLHGVK